MFAIPDHPIIVTGHCGAGKTNLTVNLAVMAAGEGRRVTVADLDIVNPYFRTADFRELFHRHGITLIAPAYANTNLDIPVLPARLPAAIGSKEHLLIIDVGGDDDGAVALGGFARSLAERGYTMLYVVNALRDPDPDPWEEAALLRGVEKNSRLRVTGLVNNTNLGRETTADIIKNSKAYLSRVAQLTGLPVLFTTSSAEPAKSEEELGISVYVKPPWEE